MVVRASFRLVESADLSSGLVDGVSATPWLGKHYATRAREWEQRAAKICEAAGAVNTKIWAKSETLITIRI